MDKAKLDELARLHGEAQKTTWQAGAAREIYAAFPAILEYVRELEGVSEEAKKERDWYNEASEERRALVRQLDVLMNGEKGAARQAALCDLVAQFPRWLAARDAQQRREGAVMKLLDMSLGGFAWDETGLRREAEAMLLDAGQRERYEQLLAEAQRLREEGK